ncbi:MAG: MarR family transcriptional regulator [Gluconacetobacter diazotrophicus]|nr:MarR family transcriptional regulator [Gluconacetobacter diazotrophicus]
MADVPDDSLALDQQLCFQLYAASNMLTRLYRPALERLGLTYPQYLVMLLLWDRRPRPRPWSVGELGVRLHLDSGTLTPLLKRLEQAGLVTRRRDPDDERRVLAAPTPRGLALRDEAQLVPDAMREGLGLSLPEVEELRTAMEPLVQTLATAVAAAGPAG